MDPQALGLCSVSFLSGCLGQLHCSHLPFSDTGTHPSMRCCCPKFLRSQVVHTRRCADIYALPAMVVGSLELIEAVICCDLSLGQQNDCCCFYCCQACKQPETSAFGSISCLLLQIGPLSLECAAGCVRHIRHLTLEEVQRVTAAAPGVQRSSRIRVGFA